MPKTKRGKPIYKRGPLELHPRAGRANLEIIWYDPVAGRERSTSAGTEDVGAASAALDEKYWQLIKGLECCPTCRRPFDKPESERDPLMTLVIEGYLVAARKKGSFDAIEARLKHIVTYIAMTDPNVRPVDITPEWVKAFRDWNIAVPIVSPKGKERPRAISTVENSVLQLAAALRHANIDPLFEVIPTKEVIATPTFRADIDWLTKMFRYCLYPDAATARSDKEADRRRRERSNLLRFLRISVATMARPDAAHEFTTAPAKRQWHTAQKIVNLNPHGRRQTRKYRASVPIARQFAPHLDDCKGNYITVESVENAWVTMEGRIGLPRNGQSGMKLVRRSIANIVRSRLPFEQHAEVSMFLGHNKTDDTTDLYAPFSPAYLRNALKEIEGVIDQIERGCPGAFYREFTASGGKVVALGVA